MRTTLTLLLVIAGFAVQAISYFFLAAPLGIPVNEAFSNPKVPFAAGLFVLGVMLVFIGAVVYELYPEKEAR
jgi:hypothetical protein